MKINFAKNNGLIPAIIQDDKTGRVLMLGYMNKEALKKTEESRLVTFYSRSRGKLWTKGETSGNYLKVIDIIEDCDNDTLLIKVDPSGPVCHTGTDTCFNEKNSPVVSFTDTLEKLIWERKKKQPNNSYTSSLFRKGTKKIAQKVVEEAGEVSIEAVAGDRAHLIEETADLLYHLLVLLADRDVTFAEVIKILENRHSG